MVQLFRRLARRVPHVLPVLYAAREDAKQRDVADVRLRDGLEDLRRQGPCVVGLEGESFRGAPSLRLDRRTLMRRRTQFDELVDELAPAVRQLGGAAEQPEALPLRRAGFRGAD